jgi:hypothetical protein
VSGVVVSTTSPIRWRLRVDTQVGSATRSRPARNAWVFMATDTPLSVIACSMAAALTGIAPAW